MTHRYIGPIYRTALKAGMIDFAILGLLKDQPLHGYELKKRLGETLGSLWGFSYGSLYPALRRLERTGAIEVAAADSAPEVTAIPSTGSVKGEAAAARLRRLPTPGRRNRKAYRITARGDDLFTELLTADDGNDTDREFALKLAFCRFLPVPDRVALLERRRAQLSEHLTRARRTRNGKSDRYTRSLMEHGTKSIERDLEWVDDLLAAERSQEPLKQEEATA
jgi:DNA-binding PadR family transcriptional regulator